MLNPVPTALSDLKALGPGVYGFVSKAKIDGFPDELPETLARYEVELHSAGNQNTTVRLRCIDGGLQLYDFYGELHGENDSEIRWAKSAVCTAPAAHRLPLASNIQNNGSAIYWKDQFNVVTVIMDYGQKTAGTFTPGAWELLATLPEGYRPSTVTWRMCDDSESGSAVATCRVDTNGQIMYRASAQSQYLFYFGHIAVSYIAKV